MGCKLASTSKVFNLPIFRQCCHFLGIQRPLSFLFSQQWPACVCVCVSVCVSVTVTVTVYVYVSISCEAFEFVTWTFKILSKGRVIFFFLSLESLMKVLNGKKGAV